MIRIEDRLAIVRVIYADTTGRIVCAECFKNNTTYSHYDRQIVASSAILNDTCDECRCNLDVSQEIVNCQVEIEYMTAKIF